jgi:hypothetical protein
VELLASTISGAYDTKELAVLCSAVMSGVLTKVGLAFGYNLN